jgi:hypothetical protein
MRGSPKSRRRCAPVMMCRSGEMQTGMNFAGGTHRQPVAPPELAELQAKIHRSVAASGSNFNAYPVNRFALKRPFAAAIIYCALHKKTAAASDRGAKRSST